MQISAKAAISQTIKERKAAILPVLAVLLYVIATAIGCVFVHPLFIVLTTYIGMHTAATFEQSNNN